MFNLEVEIIHIFDEEFKFWRKKSVTELIAHLR